MFRRFRQFYRLYKTIRETVRKDAIDLPLLTCQFPPKLTFDLDAAQVEIRRMMLEAWFREMVDVALHAPQLRPFIREFVGRRGEGAAGAEQITLEM